MTFISGRLSLAGRWYERRSDDRFTLYSFGQPNPLSEYAWKKAPRETILDDSQELVNKGGELEFSATAIQKENLMWSFSGNFSYNDGNEASFSVPYPLPKFLAGIGTRFCYGGLKAELWGRGAWGNSLSSVSLASAAVSYTFSLKRVKFIKALSVSLSAAGIGSPVYNDIIPPSSTVMSGISVKF